LHQNDEIAGVASTSLWWRKVISSRRFFGPHGSAGYLSETGKKGGFHSHGDPQNGWFVMENPKITWMMTGF